MCVSEENLDGAVEWKVQEGEGPFHSAGVKHSPVPHNTAWPLAALVLPALLCWDAEAGVKEISLWTGGGAALQPPCFCPLWRNGEKQG